MKKKMYIGGVCLLLMCLLVTGTVSIFMHEDQMFSESENRMLTQKPEFHLSDFLKKEYQTKQETYLSDQFTNRQLWMSLKTNIELMLNRHKINDIYIGKNGMLAQEFQLSVQDTKRQQTIQAINDFDERYKKIKTHMLLVPSKIGLYYEQFDTYSFNQQKKFYQQVTKQFSQKIHTIDTWSVLEKHKNENIFFKTDHHWTGLGAKYVAEDFLNKTFDDYIEYIGNDSFYGSLSKKIGYQKATDIFKVYDQKNREPYIVEYPNVKETSTTFYDVEKLQSADPYTTYFGGNYPVVKITSANRQKKNLLIFKDSFANIFVPYLMPYYHKIIMVDPRYYYDDIHMLLKDEDIHEILYLMNMNTFFSDSSLLQILQ